MATLAEFRGQFRGGARPTLYRMTMTFPSAYVSEAVDAETKFQFSCTGTSLPGIQSNTIDVWYMGRAVKVAGDRTFEALTLTILNDNDWKIRTAFEQWMNGINNHRENVGAVHPDEYQVDALLEQLDRRGNVIARYRLIGAFPEDVSNIELNYSSVDTIEDFNVTLAYQWWEREEQGII